MSKFVKLSDTFAKVIDYRGKTPKKLGGDWSKNGYRALSALNIKTTGLVGLDSVKYVDENLYKRWMKEEIEEGDILLTSEAPAGQVIVWDSDEKIVLSQRLFALRLNKYFNNYFVKYFIQSDLGQKEILKNTTGSTVFGISAKMFDLISIPNININIQNRIASSLKSLDDKIELNNRINAELEAMAKTLYDYWFVQFDFPDENGNPYKSSGGKMVYSEELKREIPEGWEVKRIGDIINPLESGKRPKGGIDKTLKDGIPSLGAECIDKLGVFNYSSTRYIPYSYKEKITSGVIKDNDILIYKDGAYVGKTTLFRDNFPFSYAVVNEHVFLMRAKKKEMQEYLLLTLMQNYYFNIMQSLAQKAAQPGLNQEDLKSIIIIVPNDYITNKFNCITVTMFKNLFSLANENQQLASLRDWLLPMLMNGQVGFKETTHKEEIIKSQQKKQHLELLLSQ